LPFNRFIIARSLGLKAVTVFEIAYSGSMQIRALLDSGFRALIPEVSALATLPAADRRTRLRRLDRQSTLVVLALGVPAYAALAVLAEPLLRVWLRGGFVPELTGAFRIMLVASFVSLVGVPAYYFLLSVGAARWCLWAHVVQAAGNVTLLLILPVLMGGLTHMDAPISVAFGSGLATILLCWQMRRVRQQCPVGTRTTSEVLAGWVEREE
jgi:O-antigen/teichoic acid export membrane protein